MVKSEQKIQSSKAMSSSSTSSWGSTSPQQSPPQSSSCYKKKFKGVRMRSWGSWVSEIRAPNQKTRIWLGSYSTPEAAARAYDAALVCLKGSSANLNFPIDHLPFPIPNPADSIMSPKSIQRVAAAAAAATNYIDPPPPPTPSSPSLTHSADQELPTSSSMADAFPVDELPNYNCWFDDFDSAFQSPKYLIDPDLSMSSSFFFNPPNMIVDYEDPAADIPLWSFC